jgi:hypothetical protein
MPEPKEYKLAAYQLHKAVAAFITNLNGTSDFIVQDDLYDANDSRDAEQARFPPSTRLSEGFVTPSSEVFYLSFKGSKSVQTPFWPSMLSFQVLCRFCVILCMCIYLWHHV